MKKKYELIFWASVVTAIFWFGYSHNKWEEELFQKGNFSIGYIDKYEYYSKGSGEGYRYHFRDEQYKRYHYFNSEGIGYSKEERDLPSSKEREKIKKGDRYLVLYDEDGAKLYYKFPIKDTSDYERYIKSIEEIRKTK